MILIIITLRYAGAQERRLDRTAAVTLSRRQRSACATTSRPTDRPTARRRRRGRATPPSRRSTVASPGRQDPSSVPSLVRSFHVRPASQHIAILPSSPVRGIRNRHALKSNFISGTYHGRSAVVTPASSVVRPDRIFRKKKKN